LGLDILDPLDPHEVPRSRPLGLDAAKAIRELRDGKVRVDHPIR
jgi:hypothetical protein